MLLGCSIDHKRTDAFHLSFGGAGVKFPVGVSIRSAVALPRRSSPGLWVGRAGVASGTEPALARGMGRRSGAWPAHGSHDTGCAAGHFAVPSRCFPGCRSRPSSHRGPARAMTAHALHSQGEGAARSAPSLVTFTGGTAFNSVAGAWRGKCRCRFHSDNVPRLPHTWLPPPPAQLPWPRSPLA